MNIVDIWQLVDEINKSKEKTGLAKDWNLVATGSTDCLNGVKEDALALKNALCEDGFLMLSEPESICLHHCFSSFTSKTFQGTTKTHYGYKWLCTDF